MRNHPWNSAFRLVGAVTVLFGVTNIPARAQSKLSIDGSTGEVFAGAVPGAPDGTTVTARASARADAS